LATLFLVSTPIGNLDDMTVRAANILKEQEVILAEDTRVLKKLCENVGIDLSNKRLFSFNDHDQNNLNGFINLLNQGTDLCLVSDAGSPIISDPAYPLVKSALEKGHHVDSIPGISSVIVALELSGLPPHPFTFHGFFPREQGKREEVADSIRERGQTHIFFESPHRIVDCLDFLSNHLSSAQFSVSRELTKKFQETLRFDAKDWAEVKDSMTVKGEFVVVVNLAQQSGVAQSGRFVAMANEVLERADQKKIAKLLGQILNQNAKEIYQILEAQKSRT